jgi:hypothetical protein
MAADETTEPREDCDLTRGRIAEFISGRLGRVELSAMRAHRKECAACDTEWRASMSTAADLRRRGRVSDEQREREERREHNRRLALEGAFATPTRKNRRVHRARQRLILLPALAIVLMTVIYPLSRRSVARLEVLAGEVQLSYRTLGADESGIAVRRGDWFSTGEGTRARLTLGKAEFEVGPSSRVLVEDGSSGRARLEDGELSVNGDGLVTSSFGVVRFEDAEGIVRAVAGGFEVEGRVGSLVVMHSGGEETVGPGERTLLAVR